MIEINNLTVIDIDQEWLKKIAKKVLGGEKVKDEIELSIALIGPGRMREINKRYRGKNRVTDVLAFPESRMAKEKFRVGLLKKVQGLGEIAICLREVKKNSKKFKSSFEQELKRVLIHGLLHLLGYDHEKSEEKAKEMEKKQQHYFSKV